MPTDHAVLHAHGSGVWPGLGLWANLLIGLSYVVISASLVALVARLRSELPYRWIFGLFGLFIVACGAGHLSVALAGAGQAPRVDAAIAVVTVLASVGTAAVMPFLIPAIAGAVRDAREAAARRVEIAALERSNRMKADFMAAMSHELRTPLNAIVGYTQLLDSELAGPLTDTQREHLLRIARAGRHLGSLVDDVLDFERLSAGRYDVQLTLEHPALLGEEALQLLRPMADEKGVELRAELPPSLQRSWLDARAFRQILLNLLSNAIKYTPRGYVALTIEARGDEVRVVVQDTGIGIAPGDQRRVFEPFWQADQKLTRAVGGAGLGLPITRALAEKLGGTITLESTPGMGTRVEVQLPASEPRPRIVGATELSQGVA